MANVFGLEARPGNLLLCCRRSSCPKPGPLRHGCLPGAHSLSFPGRGSVPAPPLQCPNSRAPASSLVQKGPFSGTRAATLFLVPTLASPLLGPILVPLDYRLMLGGWQWPQSPCLCRVNIVQVAGNLSSLSSPLLSLLPPAVQGILLRAELRHLWE